MKGRGAWMKGRGNNKEEFEKTMLVTKNNIKGVVYRNAAERIEMFRSGGKK